MPKVALSYSHSDKYHDKLMLFVKKLEENDIETIYDKKNLSPGTELTLFMENLTLNEDIDYVIVVCEKTYRDKADKETKGGVRYEARNLRHLIQEGLGDRIIPVVFEHDDKGAVRPKFLLPSTYIDVSNDIDFSGDEFLKLVKHIKTKLHHVNYVNSNSTTGQNVLGIGLSQVNNIGFHRKRNIVNRNEIAVQKIIKYFNEHQNEDISNIDIPLIYAFNGEGKTTVLLEIAYRIGKQFSSTILIDVNQNIIEQCVEVLPNKEDIRQQDYRHQLQAFTNYIKQNRSLLMFDNVKEIVQIENLIPVSGISRVIVATTNCINIGLEYVIPVELPKLSIEEATQILTQNIVYEQKDLDVIHKIANLYDLSPFGLELANSYLRSHPGLNFQLMYECLHGFTIKLERSSKISSNIINSAPNIASIIARKIDELDESDIIDKLTKDIVIFAGILQIIKADLYFEIFMSLLNIDRTKSDSLRNFSETKLRLQELGLGSFDDKHFVLHTFVCEYSKEFLLRKEYFSIIINYYRTDLLRTLDTQIYLGAWCNYAADLDSYNLAFEYYMTHWPAANMLENEYIVTHVCALFDINYFSSHFKKALGFSQIGVEILRYKIFTADKLRRLKGVLYLKALALHQMEKWDAALKLYEEIITGASDVNLSDKVNSLFYLGHIHTQMRNFEQALICYDLAMQCVDNDSNTANNNPAYYEYKLRYHLYLCNYYNEVGDIAKGKSEKRCYENTLIKLWDYGPVNGYTKELSKTALIKIIKKNLHCLSFSIHMELNNNKPFKPFYVRLSVRCVQEIQAKYIGE